jgi:MSHA biogenesis protein MshP
MTHSKAAQKGFAIAAALAILAVCAVFGIFLLKMFTLGQEGAARDALGEKALQAARAGADYATYQSLVNGSCANATIAFPGFAEFTVALTCSRSTVSEGGASVLMDSWISTACSSTPCPGTASASYIERQVKLDIAK